jgi:polysaccharide export outer membrane protein
MKIHKIFVILILVLFTSCVSKKSFVYLNDIESVTPQEINDKFVSNYPMRIAGGDILLITVSALDPEAVAIFNLPVTSYATPGSMSVNSSPVMQYYVVDPDGNIDFPVIGKIKLVGYTIDEASNFIASKVKQFVNNPVVYVRFNNYQITILGEVRNPGRFTFNSQRMTILDAIGMAGDLTYYGRRKDILVIREDQGKLIYGRIDLTSQTLFSSPYYFLRQNDVIYIEPTKERVLATQQINFYLSIFSTITTVTAVVFSFLK